MEKGEPNMPLAFGLDLAQLHGFNLWGPRLKLMQIGWAQARPNPICCFDRWPNKFFFFKRWVGPSPTI
jgi:hypothetical protein